MIAQLLRRVCALSVLCGAAVLLSPEGKIRRVMRFVCAVVLLASVLTGVRSLDLDEFALETALYRERERQFLEQSESIAAELDRRVIESRCEAYILDKVGQMGIRLQEAKITAQWHTEGVWIPWAAHLAGDCTEEERGRIRQMLESDLGIPAERQEWN